MSVTAERALEESVTFHTAKSFCWAWLLVTFSYPALAAPIYQETLQGNGETRLLIERSLNVAESGRYFLTLKNGDLGPRNIEQCESEDTVSAKRECLFENLNERIEQNFTRMRDALIHVNGVRVRHSLAPNERTITQARGLLKIPVELTQGVNTLKVDYLGYSTAKLHLDLEKAPETPSAPFARFLLNRITGNTTQEFRLNARESFSPEAGPLTYAWAWGDEAEGFVPVPSVDTLVTHTYQTAGTYHAKLVVTDTLSGLSSEFGIDLVVTAVNPNTPPENESPKPIIQWAVDPLNPMRVTFNASQSSDDGEIASYAWRFTNQAGQHTNLTGETLSYTFFNPGSYTVRLGVTDNLGKTAYQTRVISLATLSELVHDEILLTQNNYFGTFETEAIYTENISIPEAKLGKIRIKNADGQDHPIQDCSLIALPAKIGCLYDNLVNRTYVQLYRVSSANIYVNGRKVTDSLSINKQKKDFETVVSLNQTNTIEIRVRGWPTAFVNVEIQALETNLPPVAIATHSTVKRGAPQTIEFQATQSTDPNDQVVSYRFQAKQEGSSAWTVDTDWQASGIANLTFPSVGRWQVLTSARDKFGAVGQTENLIEILPNSLPTLQITYGIYTNQTPYRVQVRANSTDADGDTLLYNFAFSNGQTTGFQALSTAVSMFNVSGNQSVTVSVRDQNGGETVGTASFVLGGNLVPIASFSFASPRAGYAPHTVSFDASNSSDPDGSVNDLQYFWNFGDGTTGAGKLVDHTFQLGGEYIVTLTVLDPLDGAGSQSRAIFSWTNEPPVPRYTVTAVPGTLQRIFNASGSTPGDSAIQRYNFETGDGNFIVQTTPIYTHTYSNGGVYNTSLRVYDAEGDANITGQTITVFNGQNPAANINLVAADVVTPATFIFNTEGSASPNNGATINGWRWTLPDGQIVLGPELFYQTNTHGNFSITLQVRDSFGFWSDPVTQEFSATSGVLPIARIEASKTSATPNEPIRFSGLTSSTLNANANLVSYEWSTPSGTKFYGPEVDIGLSQLGLNTVTLIVTDSKGYVSEPASFQVNISTPTKPVAIFTLSDAGNIIPIWRHADGRDSYATALGASIIGYEWRIQAPDALPNGIDFNLYGPEVDILFNQAVTYTVSLRVFDSSGETSDWVSQTFGPLQNTKPIANFLPGSITVTAPAIINFSSLGSFDPDGHDIIGYYWDMGDGLDRYESNFQHQYNLPGVYTVEFAVQDSFGLWSDPVFATITVVENELPIPVITMQDDPGGNRFKKLFSATQSSDPDGEIVEYHWFVAGQPRFASGPEVEYTFPAPGHYTIGLDVTDNKGAASFGFYQVEILENQAPVIRAKYEVDDMNPMRFSLDGSASTDDTTIATFVWRNGGNVIGTSATLNHTFSSEGIYDVSLEITDADGASASKNFAIYAYENGSAGFMLHEPSDNVVDPETGVEYFSNEPIPMSGWPKALVLQPRVRHVSAEGLSYSWLINDVEVSEGRTPQIAFTNPGQTKLSLIVNDGENVIAKFSRTIEPDIMSCGSSYQAEGTRCLTIPGVHSYIKATNGADFEIPLGESFAGLEVARVTLHRRGDESEASAIDVTSVAVFNDSYLRIPANALLDREESIAGAWRLTLTMNGPNDEVLEAELPYFVLSSSAIELPNLPDNDILQIRDLATGLLVSNVLASDGPTISIPSTDLEFTLVSTTRRPAIGILSANSNYQYTINHNSIEGSEFDQYTFSASSLNSTSIQGSKTSFTAISAQSSSSTSLSFSSGIVAFTVSPMSHMYLGNIGTEYVTAVSGQNGISQAPRLSGRLKRERIPWNAEEVGSDPEQSTTKTVRQVYCAAYEGAWNRTPEIDRLNGYYRNFLQARQNTIYYENDVYNIGSKISAAATLAREAGFDNCNYYAGFPGDVFFSCHLDYLAGSNIDLVAPAAIPHLRTMQSLWLPYLHYKSLRDQARPTLQQQEIRYFTFGDEIGFDYDQLQSASWRKYLMPDSTNYRVVAKFRIGNSTKSIEVPFSSAGMRGTYVSNIHADPFPPMNPFTVPGLEMKELQFEFPANAVGIEFEVRSVGTQQEYSREYIPESSGRIAAGHSSIVYKQSSASCKLAPPGYTVRQVYYDIERLEPQPGPIEGNWHHDSFINWPQSISVESILRENSSLTNKRFFTYAAQSLMTENRFVPIDLDKLAVEHGNPLEYIFSGSYRRVTTLPSAAELNIPVRVVVSHFGFDQPTSVQVRGVYNGNTVVLKSIGLRDGLVSRPDLSIYRTELPYSSIANHLRSQFQTDTRPLDRRKYVLEVIPIAPTGRVEPRRISLTPLLNARYDQFWESEGAAKRSQYSTTVSAFVNPTMAEIVKVLDEVGNQVTPQDFYHNDGTLPFAQKTGSHRGHNTGKMLDVRTFGIGPSTYEFVDNKSTNATPAQMFVATNTKYADLARLMKMSYRALEFNKTVETGKLKTAAQCQTESGTNPPTCTPSTELTIEKCLIAWIELSTSELSEKEVTCANMRTNVESYEITKQQILDSHSRYRDYILRNRQALLRFKELMQERGLAMPMIMYSFGDNETSREAISLMADIDISTDAIWNLRSLKDGTIPLDENRSATDRISLLTQDGVPIGTSTAHSMLREDKSHTHLDHYHFEEIEK